jgi:hypothetical protein
MKKNKELDKTEERLATYGYKAYTNIQCRLLLFLQLRMHSALI